MTVSDSHSSCYFSEHQANTPLILPVTLLYLFIFYYTESLRARVTSNLQYSSILGHTGGTPRLNELIGHIHWAQARFYQGRGQEHSQVKSTGCAFFLKNPDSATY